MKKTEQKQHLIDMMKDDEELGLYDETFDEYLIRLKDRRTEDGYKYTDEDFEKYKDYIKNCYQTNLSVYKCLEWMSFAEKEIQPEQIWNEEKMGGVKQLIQDHKQETLEEAADRLYPYEVGYGVFDRNCEIDVERERFIKGAKWQQDKICNSEVLQRIRASKSDAEARRIIKTI